MSNNKKLSFTLLILCCVTVCRSERDFFDNEMPTIESTDEYVDPHSLYYDRHTQKEVSPSYLQQIGEYIGGSKENGVNCGACDEELRLCRISVRNRPKPTDVADKVLSRRIVNMLLSRAKFSKEGQLFSGLLELEATDSELQALKKFGDGRLTLREVDPILNSVMKTPEMNRIYESAIWMYNMSSWMYSSASYLTRFALNYKEFVVSVIFTLYMIHTLREMRYNLWMVLTFSTITILIISFFITWWKLIQEAEISHSTLQMKHMKMPVHCQPEKMSFWDKLTTWFSSTDDCKKYHEAMMKTPFLQVTPAQALSHMLSHVFYEPIALSGKALASFLQHLTADMSPFFSGIVQILICVTFLPGLICCIILTAGGSLSFGPLSFFTLKGPERTIKKRRNKSLESKTDRRPIEVMLNETGNARSSEGEIIEPPRLGNKRGWNRRNMRASKMALTDVPKHKEKTDKTESSTSETITNGASGDCNLTSEKSDSLVESVDIKAEVRESREVGSGDGALE